MVEGLGGAFSDFILIVANIALALLVAYTCYNIDNMIVHIQKPTFSGGFKSIIPPDRSAYRLYYTILFPLTLFILLSDQSSSLIAFEVAALFGAAIWLSKSIAAYEEQVQEYEME